MAWICIIVIASLSLWLLSLFRALYFSRSVPAGPPPFSRGANLLLVVAHPDDESMFFAPTILFLTSQGYNVHIICMSTGNAEGKGIVRQKEFYQACAILKVPLQQVKILDHSNLLDGFDKPWDHRLVATIVGKEVKTWHINSLITFDKYGVSGHPNHRDVHLGICMLLRANSQRNIEAWELVSVSILRKYTGPVDIWLSLLCALSSSRNQMYCLLNSHPRKCYLAMAEHYSQWVWFRKLFVLLSCYTYKNSLRKMDF